MMSLIEFKQKKKKKEMDLSWKVANANLKKLWSRLVITYMYIIYIIRAAPFPWFP